MLPEECSVNYAKHDVSKQVIKLLASNPENEYSAKQIAILLKVNYSSVRSCLTRLVKRGLVIRPHRGFYKWANASDIGYGVGRILPRVHNLVLSCRVPKHITNINLKEEKIEIGSINLRFLYGEKRGRVTVWISCNEGLNAREFKLCLALIRLYISKLYDFSPTEDELVVKSLELNEDYHGFRLDGVKCLTVSAFDGWLERIYQKHQNVIRSEIKGKRVSIDALYALLKGGVTPYNVVQGQFMLVKEIQKLTDAIKFHNQINLEIRELLLHILKRLKD